MTILGENSAIFTKIGKVYLLNWDFSANFGMFQVNWEFFQPIGKKFGTRNRTQFCIEKKPCTLHVCPVDTLQIKCESNSSGIEMFNS